MTDDVAALRVEYAAYVKEATDLRLTPLSYAAWLAAEFEALQQAHRG